MINYIKENVSQLSFQEFGSCVYLIKLRNKNILIDTSTMENRQELLDGLTKLNLKPENINIILLTHNHFDHMGNINIFKNAEIYSEKNIDNLDIKGIKIIKTPGHTKDSLCFLYKDILFSGDTIFHLGIGRTDLPSGNEDEIQESLSKLKKIKFEILCPGHI